MFITQLSQILLRPAPTVSFVGVTVSTANSTAYTFSSASLGTPAPGRVIIVGVTAADAASVYTLNSLTVGGATANQQVFLETNTLHSEIWSVLLPAGVTGDIVATFSEAITSCAIAVYATYNLTSATALATASSNADPGSATVRIPPRGIVIGNITSTAFVASGPYTWTGLTEDHDTTQENFVCCSAASTALTSFGASGLLATCTAATTTDSAMTLASFR